MRDQVVCVVDVVEEHVLIVKTNQNTGAESNTQKVKFSLGLSGETQEPGGVRLFLDCSENDAPQQRLCEEHSIDRYYVHCG